MKEVYRIGSFVAFEAAKQYVIVEELADGRVRKPDVNFKLDDSELEQYCANNTTRGIRKVGTIVETLDNSRLFIAREITLRARNNSDRRSMRAYTTTNAQEKQSKKLGKLSGAGIGREGRPKTTYDRSLVTLPKQFIDYIYTIKPDYMTVPAYIMYRILPREDEQSK